MNTRTAEAITAEAITAALAALKHRYGHAQFTQWEVGEAVLHGLLPPQPFLLCKLRTLTRDAPWEVTLAREDRRGAPVRYRLTARTSDAGGAEDELA